MSGLLPMTRTNAVMSDYDQRLMLDRLEAFSRNGIGIDMLIADLQGLLNALKEPGDSGKQDFLRWWGQIEDARARAHARYREAKALNEQETEHVVEAAVHLERMIRGRIAGAPDAE